MLSVLGTNEEPPPPQLLFAQFWDDGTAFAARFSHAMDKTI
jgi:hypothetical protein